MRYPQGVALGYVLLGPSARAMADALLETGPSVSKRCFPSARAMADSMQAIVDDCAEHYVSREQLQELLELVIEVLKHADKGEPVKERGWDGREYDDYPNAKVDIEAAKAVLPSQEGFFFGSYEYDWSYIYDLENTRDQLTTILADKKLEKDLDFYYRSSW